MKKLFVLLTFVFLLVPSYTFSKDKPETTVFTEYEGENISGLKIGSVFRVEIIESDHSRAEFEIETELLEFVKTSVKNGLLVVEVSQFYKQKKEVPFLSLRLYVPEIKKLDVSGAALINFNGSFETPHEVKITGSGGCKIQGLSIKSTNISLDCSGAVKLEAEIFADNIDINAKGAADLRLKGQGEKAKISSSGAANVKASGLNTEEIKATASGASKIDLHVLKSFGAEASGGFNYNRKRPMY
ncbi:MAG: DUF2807 domain-containing protein [Rikenellaceae bacterium]|nr:DUF2807 domain-containing protein [Rikenellaceae bacterium]